MLKPILRQAETLRDRAVEAIRAAIFEGTFAPGEKLVERKLCEWLDVSRTSVREALRQLDAEGWVENVAYRGPSVRTLAPDDVSEIYGVRAALEGYAAARYCTLAGAADDMALTDALAAMGAAAEQGDAQAQSAAVARFYAAMLAPVANPRLSAALDAQARWLSWLRRAALSDPLAARESFAEKQALAAALCARDGLKARALCERHLDHAAARVRGALVQRLHALAADGGDIGVA